MSAEGGGQTAAGVGGVRAGRGVRWWNRLAAWLCERWLHDLAMPAWQGTPEEQEERAWEDARREQDRDEAIYLDGCEHGWREGWDDAERHFAQ